MSPSAIARPRADEHAEYFGRYISQVPDGDLVSMLRDQAADTVALLQNLSPAQGDYAYAPGKWTIKQVIGHIIDAERVFVYRAMCFARGEAAELPAFDENAYVENANFAQRTLADLLEEFQVVRAATILFAKTLDANSLTRSGTANKNKMSVRALLYVIAGHERHHVKLFRERYLSH
ncbi:MAG TPA: DinB family protein [Gemmatimonadaceae bacterium]